MKITPRKYAQALAIMLDAADKAIIQNFLEILRVRKQTKMLPKIMKLLEEEWRSRRGIVKVEVQYDEKHHESLAELENQLRVVFGEKVQIEPKSTDGLIGGFRLRIGDTLIDASVAGRLKALATKLNH